MKWAGSLPRKCGMCQTHLSSFRVFIDGRIAGRTQWGILCPPCYKEHGIGLGLGKGQMYDTVTGEKLYG